MILFRYEGYQESNCDCVDDSEFDNEMMKKYPHLTGVDKFHWVVPSIVVVGSWANSKGADQDDSHVDALFERFGRVPGMFRVQPVNTIFP